MRVVAQNLPPELTLVEKVGLLIFLVLQLVNHILDFQNAVSIFDFS